MYHISFVFLSSTLCPKSICTAPYGEKIQKSNRLGLLKRRLRALIAGYKYLHGEEVADCRGLFNLAEKGKMWSNGWKLKPNKIILEKRNIFFSFFKFKVINHCNTYFCPKSYYTLGILLLTYSDKGPCWKWEGRFLIFLIFIMWQKLLDLSLTPPS